VTELDRSQAIAAAAGNRGRKRHAEQLTPFRCAFCLRETQKAHRKAMSRFEEGRLTADTFDK